MTAVDASAAGRRVSMIDRRPEDRWIAAPVRKASLAMAGLVLASFAFHAMLLLLAATFGDRTPPPRSQETTVELVQEPASPPQETRQEAGPKAEPAKADVSELRKAPVVEPEPQKAAAMPPEPPVKDPKIAENEAALEGLKQELNDLKAEQDAVKAENAAAAAALEAPEPQALKPEAQKTEASQTALAPPATTPVVAGGIGPIPPSFNAVQLPALSEIAGDATGYQQIVFGQLAKTKGIRRHMGQEGTAGIVFTIDASGQLAEVTIAHPSGSAALDDEALQIVKGSAPFPKPPPGATRTMSANFTFNHVSQSAP